MANAVRVRFLSTHRIAGACLLASLATGASAIAASAQSAPSSPEPVRLRPGVPVDAQVSGAARHLYEVTLATGEYAKVLVEPKSTDVRVRLIDPAGNLAIESDDRSPREAFALEFATDAPAAFSIEAAAAYAKAPSGGYQIRIVEVRKATERDRRLFEARQSHARAGTLLREWKSAEAEPEAQRALEVLQQLLGAEHPDLVAPLDLLGRIATAQNAYARAEALLRRALGMGEKLFGTDHPRVASVLNNLARNYAQRSTLPEAQRAAERALSIRRANFGERHPLTARSMLTLFDIYEEDGNYGRARVLATRALEITRETVGPEDLTLADALHRAGRDRVHAGDFAGGEQLMTESLIIREKLAGAESIPVAESLFTLAYIALQTGKEIEAEGLYKRVVAIREKIVGPDDMGIALNLNNLGLIAYRRRDFGAAEQFHLRSLAITEKIRGRDTSGVVYSLNNLGLVYWRQKNYPKAKDFFLQALKVGEVVYGPEHFQLTAALNNLGIVYKETGDYDRAEEYYRRSVAIVEETYRNPYHPRLIVGLESLAILYRDSGEYDRAEPLFLRVLEISRRAFGPDHPNIGRHLGNLAHLYQAKGDRPRALAALRRVADIDERLLAVNIDIGSERQKLAFFEPFLSRLEHLISFHIKMDPENGAARDLAARALLQRKARVFDAMADTLSALTERSSPEERARFEKLRDVTSQLSAAVLGGPRGKPLSEHEQRIQDLTRQREQLEDEVGRLSAGRYARTNPVTLAEVAAAVPPGAALLEFVQYRPFDPTKSIESTQRYGELRYAVYVITCDAEVRWTELGSAADIDAAIEALRKALQDPRRKDVAKLARALDKRVMEPIRALDLETSRFLVSPDGQLALVPFEALVDGSGRYLVERFSFTYLSAGRDLLRMHMPRASSTTPVIVANPLFGEPNVSGRNAAETPNAPSVSSARRGITSGPSVQDMYFAPLAGTLQEARSIQSVFPDGRILSGAEATESALKRVNAPRLLHIATHGFFLRESGDADAADINESTRGIQVTETPIANPLLRSGLALAGANLPSNRGDDGVLTALEAAHLNLWGTKLVTLSACDTGVGVVSDGDGVYGLRRSIFLAGAETLVMSLWPVSDYITREMMTAFYKGLKSSLGRGEALRQVQLAMLKRSNRSHPFYWASFIQAGEWGNLDGKR